MSALFLPLFLLACWAILCVGTLRYYGRRKPGDAYNAGFEAGWKQHVAAQLSEDPEFRNAYTQGWLAAVDTLKKHETARFDATYENGRADGWQEAIDRLDPFGTHRRMPL